MKSSRSVVGFLGVLLFGCPSGMWVRRPSRFGTPARRAARWGRLWGCAPFATPLHPPRSTPLGEVFNSRGVARARGSSCGSFLPSLCSVRRSPSAPRKCHSPLSLWAESASAENPISLRVDGQPLTLPSLTRRDCPSSLFPELQIPQAPTKNSLHDSKKFAFSADTNPKAKM